MIKRWALALVAACFAAAPVHAAESDGASGDFTSQSAHLIVHGAVAFRGTSFLDGDALIVAVSNARLKSDVIADYYDRRRAIERHVKDDETGVVYFEFTPEGRYRGLSYYFGPGNGCGYCTSEVSSSVKLAGGRLTGTLKGTEASRPFDLKLDVPVLSDQHGPALPADGGAPGKVYLAYHAALAKRDATALRPLLSQSQLDIFENAKKQGRLEGFLSFLADEHPVRVARIDKGYANDRAAVLLISGESAAGNVTGEALLVKEAGEWKVDDELVSVALP